MTVVEPRTDERESLMQLMDLRSCSRIERALVSPTEPMPSFKVFPA